MLPGSGSVSDSLRNSAVGGNICHHILVPVSHPGFSSMSRSKMWFYRLLGWSTFAGYLVLLAGWPLNSFIMKRAIRIQKGLAVARDKRMQVVNELIGAVSPFSTVHLLLGSLKRRNRSNSSSSSPGRTSGFSVCLMPVRTNSVG